MPLSVARRSGCGQSLADEDGVQVFEVGEDDELFDRGAVADIALGVGVGVAPLLGGLSEQGDVEQVGLAGINGRCLSLRDGWWKEGLLDGVGVDAEIDFGEGALKVSNPASSGCFPRP